MLQFLRQLFQILIYYYLNKISYLAYHVDKKIIIFFTLTPYLIFTFISYCLERRYRLYLTNTISQTAVTSLGHILQIPEVELKLLDR